MRILNDHSNYYTIKTIEHEQCQYKRLCNIYIYRYNHANERINRKSFEVAKNLYYEQAWYMVVFGHNNQLFSCASQAWVNGPVYPDIYYAYKDMVPGMCDHLKMKNFLNEDENPHDKEKELVAKMNLIEDEIALTERVILLYGSRTQNQYNIMKLTWEIQAMALTKNLKIKKPICILKGCVSFLNKP